MTTPQRKVWFNGAFVAECDARISVFDSALMFGDMVFEMTRSFNKEQFQLREHLERLYASIKFLRIPMEISIDQLEDIVHETIAINEPAFTDDDEHRIMIDVTRGTLSLYERISGLEHGTNVIVADFPLRWTVAGMSSLYEEGINAVIPSQRAIPAHLLEPKVKNRSRIHYQMANIEVSGYAGKNNWALLLDPDGFIAEGTGDNFFIIKDGRIITPEGRNILRGISRQYVMDVLAPQLGIDCVEANIDVYDTITADEAFMTGTPFCMLPVGTLNGLPIGDAPMGPVTRQLLDAWSQNVGLDIIQQIRKWDQETGGADSTKPSPYAFKR